MSKLMSRVEKLEEAWDKKHPSDWFRVVFGNPDETNEQCLERYGLSGDFPGLTVIIVRWISGKERLPISPDQTTAHEKDKSISIKNDTKPTSDTANLDAEIEKIKTELREEGFTDLDIAEAMADASPVDSSNQDSELPTEPDSAKPDDGPLKVSPMRADDLTRFGR